MATLWSDLLGVDQAAPEADFFDLGGHSLAAVRLFAKIRKEFLTDLPLATLFQSPTLRSLSEVVIDKGNIELDVGEKQLKIQNLLRKQNGRRSFRLKKARQRSSLCT